MNYINEIETYQFNTKPNYDLLIDLFEDCICEITNEKIKTGK